MAIDPTWPASVQKVARALESAGLPTHIVLTDASARTAAQAAQALGVDVAQIAKSLIFRTLDTARAVLVITAGDHRVSEQKVATVLGELIGRADAAFVREVTGFAIGGVPPLAHAHDMVVLADQTLLRFDEVWAAAGTPNAVFSISPQSLVTVSGATLADVHE
jgi:prolyl-tRNA editing enzyme YbaK/EbsC (Cys-tRNA(Pro) deacylase)